MIFLIIAASRGDIDETSTIIPRIFPLYPNLAPLMHPIAEIKRNKRIFIVEGMRSELLLAMVWLLKWVSWCVDDVHLYSERSSLSDSRSTAIGVTIAAILPSSGWLNFWFEIYILLAKLIYWERMCRFSATRKVSNVKCIL